MPIHPPSPDPTGASPADHGSNPFGSIGAGLGAGFDFLQDWIKAAGSALPHLQGAAGAATSAIPAWTMPTLDPAELEKRIKDLKTVQFWLEQNARMIGMTIQALEVQRMTLTTLKGMNVSMDTLRESLKARVHTPAASPTPAPHPEASGSGSDDAPASASEPTGADQDRPDLINPIRWWDTLTQQFTHLASQAAQTVGDSVGESMDMIKQAQSQAADFVAAPKRARSSGAKSGAKTSATSSAKSAGAKSASGKAKTSARKSTRGGSVSS